VGGRLRGHDVSVAGGRSSTRNVILAKARTHDTSSNFDVSGCGCALLTGIVV